MAEPLLRRCKPLLGTFVEVCVPTAAADAASAAFADIAHVHARMSFHDEGSDLAALRRARTGTAVLVDPATVQVLALAKQLFARSAGLFDVAVGARLVAAGFLPRPSGIDLRRMRGTSADIELLGADRVVCHRPMLIDLGGIAKGFAVDRAIDRLLRAGVDTATVNAGGDLRVIGETMVQLRSTDHVLGGVLRLTDRAMASSANLHMRRRHRGRVCTPHLDRDRAAVLADGAVSVVARTCALADAMTKVALDAPALATAILAEHGGFLVRQPASAAAA